MPVPKESKIENKSDNMNANIVTITSITNLGEKNGELESPRV